jgi:hypothetical protein
MDGTLVVECLVATPADSTDLRSMCWSFALDQRAFGPRRLVVAFAHEAGRFLGLAHTDRTDPPAQALAACIEGYGASDVAAVAFCDEPVVEGPPPPGLTERFAEARAVASSSGVRLVDWISCDDQLFRSARLALFPGVPYWEGLP